MEWVETTGRSLEEAKDAALDQLGVDESEAEFEVLEEPRTGLFGRVRGEARIRARIRPARPRPKVERRDRGRKRDKAAAGSGAAKSGGGRAPKSDSGEATEGATPADGAPKKRASRNRKPRPDVPAAAAEDAGVTAPAAAPEEAVAVGAANSDESSTTTSRRTRSSRRASTAPQSTPGGDMTDDDVTVEEQAEITAAFLSGLLDAFGLESSVSRDKVDDETIEVLVDGGDLGLLIGPKGQTLVAIQDLCRTHVQRKATGHHQGRVRIDIGGYRQRRREALERFARQVAEQVIETGVQRALEPMGASDRKVVHDVANTIDGVTTLSEGEEPRRRVVIAPA